MKTIIFLFTLCLSINCTAELIGNMDFSYGTNFDPIDEGDDLVFVFSLGNIEIINTVITDFVEGSSIHLNTGSVFDSAVSKLTNGLNDNIFYTLSLTNQFTANFGANEFWSFYDNQGSVVDFYGFNIDAIEFATNQTVLQAPTDLNFYGTLSVYGSAIVPLNPAIIYYLSALVVGCIVRTLNSVSHNKSKYSDAA